MKPEYVHIIADVLAAIDAAKRGEEHERLNQMMNRTREERNRQAAAQAAFMPYLPRQIIDIDSPHYDFTTEHHGFLGAVRSD